MAKKDGRKKKDNKKGSGAADTVEAVRSAVERALPEGSRERGRELVDEVARAVTRVRGSLEQHGVFDELGKLRAEVESLARRVASLERPGAPSRTTTKPSTTRPVKARSTATKRASTASKASRTKGSSTKAASTKAASTKASTTKASSSRASKAKSSSTKRASTTKRARSKASGTRSTGSGS